MLAPTRAMADPAVEGVASFYGKGFHNGPTASGERYNMYTMTAAHRSLPFGTKLRVTNVRNGKSIVVRVNNRGPYIRGRVMDLSYGAARELGFVSQGLARIRYERIDRDV